MNLSIGNKLQAIGTLGMDSINRLDYLDVKTWIVLVGSRFDTSCLSTKTLERIETIYHENFE